MPNILFNFKEETGRFQRVFHSFDCQSFSLVHENGYFVKRNGMHFRQEDCACGCFHCKIAEPDCFEKNTLFVEESMSSSMTRDHCKAECENSNSCQVSVSILRTPANTVTSEFPDVLI